MKFFWYCPISFEGWDYNSPDNPGIGGSETAVVAMSRCLARRGHEVTVFTNLRKGCKRVDPDGGARWLPLKKADFSQKGIWVLSRCPQALDNFSKRHPGKKTWLVCQDVFYPPKIAEGLNPERLAKLDLALPLCIAQEKYLIEVTPDLVGRTVVSSNGVRADLIDEITAKGDLPERDPLKLVYTSSPDRGLPALLKIFKRAKEWVPGLKLSAAYGWDNIAKCKGKHWKNVRQQCEELMDQPGVAWLGRMGQEELYREFLSAGLWVYPTTFTETSCVSCMEAQSLGAIPVTNPLWALADNVRHGTFLHGDPGSDPLTQSRYVGEIIRLTQNPGMQEQIRPAMMEWAQQKFDWERVADQYEELAGIKRPVVVTQAPAKVSVVTATVRPDGLELVRDSLAAQTLTDYEWIICAPAEMHKEIRRIAPDAILIADPPKRFGDYYSMNKAWNALIRKAQGQLLVFACDWLWFGNDVLQRYWDRYSAGNLCVCGVANRYSTIIEGKPENLDILDTRGMMTIDPCTAVQPWAVEFNFAALDRRLVVNIGLFDEEFDLGAGITDKDMALRLILKGHCCMLDRTIEGRLFHHERTPSWEEAYARAEEIFHQKHGGKMFRGKDGLVLC